MSSFICCGGSMTIAAEAPGWVKANCTLEALAELCDRHRESILTSYCLKCLQEKLPDGAVILTRPVSADVRSIGNFRRFHTFFTDRIEPRLRHSPVCGHPKTKN